MVLSTLLTSDEVRLFTLRDAMKQLRKLMRQDNMDVRHFEEMKNILRE